MGRFQQGGAAWSTASSKAPPSTATATSTSLTSPSAEFFASRPSGGIGTLVAEYDGEPNGLKIHKDGLIFIADYRNCLMQLHPGTGRVTPYLGRRNSENFKGLNDLVFASNGDLYFTDQGQTGLHDPTGRVYRLGSERKDSTA